MEFVEGADAFRVAKRARNKEVAIPIDICCHVAAEVCNGLGYAHRKRDAEGKPLGIVHRDISPQNVLLSFSGEVKIVDFGIAKAALRSGQTEVGVIKGKYYYMSPEQAWGDPVDQRTDVFAVGLLLHELLTGQMVYQEDNIPALLDRVRKAEIPSPRAKRPDVPEELAAAILKAVAKDASDRFQSAHAFGQELTRLLYQINPTFTASRMAQLMGTLFPDDVRRHSQVLKLPSADPVPPPATQSGEQELERMSRGELAPSVAEPSMIFDLGAIGEDEGDERTRNDILPFRKRAKASPEERPTKSLRAPAQDDDEPTAQLSAKDVAAIAGRPKDEWDEETLLKDDEDWDESTLVDQGGAAMKDALSRMRARPALEVSDDEPTTDLAGEKTVAMSGPPQPRVPAGRIPAPPRPPPPPGGLPPRGAHSVRPAPPQAAAGLQAELPAEKTVAFSEAAPQPPRGGAMAGPSSAGIRLGPEADRFFSPTGSHPALASSAPAHDPFVAKPPPPRVESLGKPEPKRWILPVVLGAVALVGLIGLGVWLATRPDPTTLVIDSSPAGARVEIEGHPAASSTPMTLEDLTPGHRYHVEVELEGYERSAQDIRLHEGENRNIFVLNPVRVTLRVDTQPEGAQVWVDDVLRGSAPLEIPNLSPGTSVSVRSWTPGRESVSQQVSLTDDELHPRLVLTLPESGD